MYSLRVTFMVLLSIAALMNGFEQGAALNCRVCSSKSDAANKDDCLSSPKKVEPTECAKPPPTSTSTPPTSPSTPPTTPSTPPTTPSTPPTTPSTPPTTPSTPPTTPSTPPTTPPTTPSTPPTTPSTPPTTPSTPQTTPSTPPTTQSAPAGEPAKPANTSSTTTKKAGEDPKPDTTTKLDDGDDEVVGNGKVEALQILSKFKRSVTESRADEPQFQCYKLVYKDGETNHVDRGCAEATNTTCDLLKQDKADAECYFCTEDGCNGSSHIVLGIISTIIPMVLAILAL